mmetsp:Transcript_79320/g.161311  ORF Transcript_79320/g.161311 Transcript_79320/m.161311 type:complete len:237 (+) Transcript_79320:847-1557(+)
MVHGGLQNAQDAIGELQIQGLPEVSEVEVLLADHEFTLKGCDLFSQQQEMLHQEELRVHHLNQWQNRLHVAIGTAGQSLPGQDLRSLLQGMHAKVDGLLGNPLKCGHLQGAVNLRQDGQGPRQRWIPACLRLCQWILLSLSAVQDPRVVQIAIGRHVPFDGISNVHFHPVDEFFLHILMEAIHHSQEGHQIHLRSPLRLQDICLQGISDFPQRIDGIAGQNQGSHGLVEDVGNGLH